MLMKTSSVLSLLLRLCVLLYVLRLTAGVEAQHAESLDSFSKGHPSRKAVREDEIEARSFSCSHLDLDCNGKLSAEEVQKSSFFANTDEDGDGTLGKAELSALFDKLEVRQLIDNPNIDTVYSALSNLDKDLQAGVQVTDILAHWRNKLNALLTIEDVCDWIANAVELPQYVENFRANGVKGYDLASLLGGDGDLFLQEIGVHKLLHRKQILRSVAIRLMGIASGPPQPHLVIEEVANGIMLRWWLPESSSEQALPLHKWRLYFRKSEDLTWEFVREYESYRTSDYFNNSIGVFRVEAWNLVGRSDYNYAKINLQPTQKVLPNTVFKQDVEASNEGVNQICKTSRDWSADTLTGSCSYQSNESQVERVSLFDSADNDGDGDIDSNELWSYLQSNFHDEIVNPSQIKAAIESVMHTLDENKDNRIRERDIERYWESLAFRMDVEATGLWIEHALNLPQYKEQFISHKISGLDFAEVVANNGEKLLKQRLQIRDATHRQTIVKAMKIILLAIGEVPSQPIIEKEVDQCNGILVKWIRGPDDDSTMVIPLHKFVLSRQDARNTTDNWNVVFNGHSFEYLDKNLTVGSKYNYKLVAWNILGASKPSFLLGAKHSKCSNSLAFSLLSNFIYGIYYVLKIIMSNLLNVAAPVVAIYAAKNSKSLSRSISNVLSRFPRIYQGVRLFMRHVEENARGTKQDSSIREVRAMQSMRSTRTFSENQHDSRYEYSKQKSSDDSASVHSTESTSSANSGRSKVLWGKIRKYVFKSKARSEKNKDFLSEQSFRRAKYKKWKSSRALNHSHSNGSSNGENPCNHITYRGGARNYLVYNIDKIDEKEDLFDPNTCMICFKANLKVRHICGYCHYVVCEEHTAKKSHGRWRDCDIDSKCFCTNCFGKYTKEISI